MQNYWIFNKGQQKRILVYSNYNENDRNYLLCHHILSSEHNLYGSSGQSSYLNFEFVYYTSSWENYDSCTLSIC